MRIVIDTNLWIRILLGGRRTLPILTLWEQGKFDARVSQELLDELAQVAQRPRLQKRIQADDAEKLLQQLQGRGVMPNPIPLGYILDNLLVFFLGSFLPLSFTDGGSIVKWWGKP